MPTQAVRALSDAELGLLRIEPLDASFIELPAHNSYRYELDVWIGARSRSVTVQHAPGSVRVRAALLAAAPIR